MQRVPVRIALDPAELAAHPLRVGLSMQANVDLHDTSGPLVARQIRATPRRLAPDADREGAIDREIAAIIAANGGGQREIAGP